MAKKLLSILAAASMVASAMANLTIVSAAGGVNVADCNIENNAENVNTAAIVLTFDNNVTEEDVLEAVTINGKNDNYNVEVKDNKAQLAIKGATKNTNYTLKVAENDNETFTRSFMTGKNVYISDMSQIGTNADRYKITSDWGGKCYEMPASEKSENETYMKFSNENILDYSLESAASDGVLEISYDRYLPSYITDKDGNPTTTEALHAGWGIVDKLMFDNGNNVIFYTVNVSGTSVNPRIERDKWHNYKYVINYESQSVTFYLDGVKNSDLTWEGKSTEKFTYVKDLRFQVGGTQTSREQWIKNIKAVRKNEIGSWVSHWAITTDSDGVMTATTANTSEYKYEQVKYNFKTPITSGRTKISFEVNANEALANESEKTNDIRIGKEANGDSGKTLFHPYTKPIMDKYSTKGERTDLNLPTGVTKLTANEWHKYEMVVNFVQSGETTERVVEYMTVDGEKTICHATDNSTALACLIFTIPRVKKPELGENVLKVRNIDVIENYSTNNITVTSNIPEDGIISTNQIKINFSSPITKESLEKFKIYNEDGRIITNNYSFSLDKTQQEMTVNISDYTLNTYYKIVVDSGVGYLGGSVNKEEFEFTTPTQENITGKWVDTWWTNKAGTSITQNQDGSVTMNVVNDKVNYDDQQANRKSFAYSFDETITGTDIPLTIKYSFKANDALTKSPSPVRIYGAEKTQGSNFNMSGAYNSLKYDDWYSYNTANKPEGVDKVTPNEWHTIEYAINVNSEDGSTLKYIVYDNVITYASTTNGAPMFNAKLKGVQNIDFWFYSTTATEENYELQVKDLSVVKGAADFDITASNAELTADNNKIHLEFVNPVNEADLKSGVKVMNGESVIENAIAAYTLSEDGRSADITIADLATGNYVLSFAALSDIYGNISLTDSFDFKYTVTAKEGVVEIKSASVSEVTVEGVNKVQVSVNLSNGKFSAVSGKLIAAAYDEDNKLVGIGFADTTLSQETEKTETVTFNKPTEAYTSVKVMLWDGLNTMNALCGSANAALNSATN